MEAKEQNKRWHLIRNDNGEWISDDYAVFLTPIEATVLKVRAGQQGKELNIQHGADGQLWCYRHEYEAIDVNTPEPINRKLKMKRIQSNNIMEKRTDDFEGLKRMLNQKADASDLPQDYEYKYEKQTKNLVITLLKKGLTANMQDNGSAFESWAIILKFYLNDAIDTVTIDWQELPHDDKNNLHFNRFVYRLSKFIQTYEWAYSAKPVPEIPSVLVCNYPNGVAAEAGDHDKRSEGWIECKYVEKYSCNYDAMNHQLPVGIFYDKVSRDTHYTTGQKSAIDIWAIKNNELYIFELKKADNKVLGVISELMFYTNILHDIMSHRIQYQSDAKLKNTVKNNYRAFGELYRSYISGIIQNINAIILADKTHHLISPSLLDFINDSARLKYCRINYSMKKVDI